MGMVAIMGVTLIAYSWLRAGGALAAMTGEVDRLHEELEQLTGHREPTRRRRRDPPDRGLLGRVVSRPGLLLPAPRRTLLFSLRERPFLAAYAEMVRDPQIWSSLTYSFAIGVITIVLSTALLVPTAFWVRLACPGCGRSSEFVTPASPSSSRRSCWSFGLISSYSGPPLPPDGDEHRERRASSCVPTSSLSFPYNVRAIDAASGRSTSGRLTEASRAWAPAGSPSSGA